MDTIVSSTALLFKPDDDLNRESTNLRRTRCGLCEACRREDCGECRHCLKKTKFGGDGTNKEACVYRKCTSLRAKPAPTVLRAGRPLSELESSSVGSFKTRLRQMPRTTLREERIRYIDFGDSDDEKKKPPAKVKPQIKLPSEPTDYLVYGKAIPRHNGKCANCLGKRDEEAAAECVLLCDGQGCNREYHLGCIDPPVLEVPEGEFFCVHCDAYGTTLHLQTYFCNCDEARAEFSCSREFVASLLELNMAEEEGGETVESTCDDLISSTPKPTTKRKRSDTSKDSPLTDDDSAKTTEKDTTTESKTAKVKKLLPLVITPSKGGAVNKIPPKSEIWRIEDFYHAAMDDSKWSDKNNVQDDSTKTKIGPAFLVGKVLRLYCPVDNAYHVGRIVDWRLAFELTSVCNQDLVIAANDENPQQQKKQESRFHGEGAIACSEFLVRFSPGMNGRKTLLLKWIILEEHSVAISTTLVWGQKDKGRGMNGWKPAQILVRSSLELIPLRHLLKQNECWALTSFFGDESHVYLKLTDEAVNLFSVPFNNHRWKKAQSSSPGKFSVSNSANNIVELAWSLAMIEYEEQRRVFKWHTLPLQNAAHKKALTLVDENSLDSLEIQLDRRYEVAGSDQNGAINESDSITVPRLCPLIQRGLDRCWLANLLLGNESLENSLDTMASFKCEPVECVPSAMSHLKQERRWRF